MRLPTGWILLRSRTHQEMRTLLHLDECLDLVVLKIASSRYDAGDGPMNVSELTSGLYVAEVQLSDDTTGQLGPSTTQREQWQP